MDYSRGSPVSDPELAPRFGSSAGVRFAWIASFASTSSFTWNQKLLTYCGFQ
jgi:hypothetical protein